MLAPSRIGLVVHQERPEAATLAKETASWLDTAGHEVRVPGSDVGVAGLERYAAEPDGLAAGLDALVSLGGDGTILRSVSLLRGQPVPVVGVNLGTMGYLAEIEPHELRSTLEGVLAGTYDADDRMLLDVVVEAPDGSAHQALALNEAVLERQSSGHTVRLDVAFDGQPFTPYETDALIIATPTGSTAYAFSARGPIIEPTHRAVLLTPVSPHMLFDRSLVLEPETEIRVTVSRHRPAVLTVDGRVIDELAPGTSVRLRASRHVARLVRIRPRHFHALLKAKFGLRDR
ncbi:MAG: NAD(+)/NADH kinase [Actinobacteria bacterium]|nr:NAD(+)/NADH kinase [Actinomycetota bacterium]